jgi:hypothetical protein
MIGGAVAAPALAGSTGSTMVVLIALLIALGVAMVAVAFWLVRSTRTDAPALAPLEVMGDRGFSKADGDARTTRLTSVRPQGAPPPAPMLPYDDGDEPVSAPEEPPEETLPKEVEQAQDAAVAEDR